MRIVGQIRPDRQCVMFSATFPRAVEALARQLLVDPVEIQVRRARTPPAGAIGCAARRALRRRSPAVALLGRAGKPH
jgi:superfamily II DNA/RNA helicase